MRRGWWGAGKALSSRDPLARRVMGAGRATGRATDAPTPERCVLGGMACRGCHFEAFFGAFLEHFEDKTHENRFETRATATGLRTLGPEGSNRWGSCWIPSGNGMPRRSFFGAFWRILQASWPPKLATSGLKHAPQRRGYIRSLPMGPIDGTHGCPQKTVFSLSTRASGRGPV
eukprot:gene11376-biopygen7845